MAKSKSAKRRNAQNRSAQKHAEKRTQRSQQHPHDHLPKVGTPKDNAYIQKRRQADLVDFGLIKLRRGHAVAVGLALASVIALLLFLVLT